LLANLLAPASIDLYGRASMGTDSGDARDHSWWSGSRAVCLGLRSLKS